MFFFGIAILAQPAGRQAVPQYANILSLLAFGAYASFSLMGDHKVGNETGSILNPEKPLLGPFLAVRHPGMGGFLFYHVMVLLHRTGGKGLIIAF